MTINKIKFVEDEQPVPLKEGFCDKCKTKTITELCTMEGFPLMFICKKCLWTIERNLSFEESYKAQFEFGETI